MQFLHVMVVVGFCPGLLHAAPCRPVESLLTKLQPAGRTRHLRLVFQRRRHGRKGRAMSDDQGPQVYSGLLGSLRLKLCSSGWLASSCITTCSVCFCPVGIHQALASCQPGRSNPKIIAAGHPTTVLAHVLDCGSLFAWWHGLCCTFPAISSPRYKLRALGASEFR